jgi:hypothetical protein
MTLREQLYGGFIEEASKLFTDALTHELGDPAKFVALYALVAKLRLFASPGVIANAEQVMRRVVETYNLPNRDYRKPGNATFQRTPTFHPRYFSENADPNLAKTGTPRTS